MYYYRDKDAREIDIVLEHDGILNPLEIKKTLIQVPNSLKYSHFLTRLHVPRGKGAISKCHHTGYSKCDGILIYGWVIDVPAGESQILAKLYLSLFGPSIVKNLTPFPRMVKNEYCPVWYSNQPG